MYEKESLRLSKLSRAERFEELISFPTHHLFKVIGKSEGLSDAVREVLNRMGCPDVILIERLSSRGRYVSITFTMMVCDGKRMDEMYTALEKIPQLAYIL